MPAAVLSGHGAASALRYRAGMGLPVGKHILPTNDELVWDNGTPYPEPCIDHLAPHIGKTPKVYPYDSLRVELGDKP